MGWIWIVVRYAAESAKYGLAYRIFYGKNQRMWVVGIGILPCLCLNFVQGQPASFFRVLVYMDVVLFTFLSGIGKAKEKIWEILKLFLFYSVLDVLLELPGKIVRITADIEMSQDVFYLWESGVCIVGLCLLLAVQKKIKPSDKERVYQLLKKSVPGIVFFMIIEMVATLGCFSVAAEYVDNIKLQISMLILRSTVNLNIGFLSVFVLYSRRMNEKLLMMKQQETQLRALQKRHYELQLKKEEDTRKYRHDMHHHLMCLNALAKDREYDKLQNYLSEMEKSVLQIQNSTYVTGNSIIDIVSNAYLSELDDNVKINFQHYFAESIQIGESELCTVYANLIENAVEELKKGNTENEYILNIQLNCGERYVEIMIENSLIEEPVAAKAVRTWKEDAKQHGFGLRNVKKIVEERKGKMTIEMTENVYRVTVLMPNVASV